MKNKKSLEDGLIDLYIHLKTENMLDEYDQHKLKIEKEKLKRIGSFTILDNIKTTFEIVSDLKAKNQIELFLTQSDLNLKNNLEELLIEAEKKIRKLFRIRIKYRINNETLKLKIEELEKCNSELKKNLKLREQLTDEKKEKEIKELRAEIENQKMILTSYQNLNCKLTELEMKLRSQNIKHEKEMKSMEMRYRQKIFELGKTISKYEEIIKNSNSSNVNLINSSINSDHNPGTTLQSLISQNLSSSSSFNQIQFEVKDRDRNTPNKLNSSVNSLANALRNSISNSINKNSSYIEEEEEISQINYVNRQYSKEHTNRNCITNNTSTINMSKITHAPSQSMAINSIPGINKELFEIPKSPIKTCVKPLTSPQTLMVTDNPKPNLIENKKVQQQSDLEINTNNLQNSKQQNFGNIHTNINLNLNSNIKNSNELITSISEIKHRSPHRMNKLFYKKKNPMVQSAEFNMSTMKEQFIKQTIATETHIKPCNSNITILSRTQSQKELNDSDIKGNNPNELLDETDHKNEIFSLSSDNWNKSPRLNSRKNSSSSLQANDISMLKSSFYRRNNEPSSKSLLLARLNRSKKNPSIKSKNINSNAQSNLLEIEEHLNKIKTPIKKARSSKILKNK